MEETSSVRILYIEDEPALCELFKLAIEPLGYTVDLALNGTSGLELFADNTYDIIALDYQLPDMTGIDIARKMLSENKNTPIIIVTGQGNQRLVTEALTLGVANYVVKDDAEVYMELIPSIIAQLLDRAKKRKEKIKSDQALQQSEQRYRDLVASSPVCIHEIDLDGKIISMNAAGLRMMGADKLDEVCVDEKLKKSV